MKLVIISDTHTFHEKIEQKIPDGDVLIHCGDFSNSNNVVSLNTFIYWFESLPHKKKYLVAGNHDLLLENDTGWIL